MLPKDKELNALERFGRTVEFWRRSTTIYVGYKLTQARTKLLRMQPHVGEDSPRVKAIWRHQHEKAGQQMLDLCVDLKGFYIKSGQFLGSRGEFVPLPICEKLVSLQDKVPPMPASLVRSILEEQLSPQRVEDVFHDIDLNTPLGSASIAQVHKGHLRKDANPTHGQHPHSPAASNDAKGKAVAVKIQYPDVEKKMHADFKNLRILCNFLQHTELRFDLLSAADELQKQIEMEFDFRREATIMDSIADNLKGMQKRVKIPRSIPGLVTKRMLVMDYLEGVQVNELARFTHLSERSRKLAARRILTRLSDAYGCMIVRDGLFQADGHPGNILVMSGGRVGLLDYGQSKVLDESQRLAFAKMVLALNQDDKKKVVDAMEALGIVTQHQQQKTQVEHAYNMFDTRGITTDLFGPNSLLKTNPITEFPQDFVFVLRTVQDLEDFSCAAQWKPYAQHAVKHGKGKGNRNPTN